MAIYTLNDQDLKAFLVGLPDERTYETPASVPDFSVPVGQERVAVSGARVVGSFHPAYTRSVITLVVVIETGHRLAGNWWLNINTRQPASSGFTMMPAVPRV